VLEVYYSHSGEPDTDSALVIFKKFNIKNQSVNIYPGQDTNKTRAFFLISLLDNTDTSKLAKAFEACQDVERVEIKEKI
jgi:hypothetical protein